MKEKGLPLGVVNSFSGEVMRTKQVIVVRKDLNMRKGKIAAQVAHASIKVFFDRMTAVSETEEGHQIYHGIYTPEMIEWKNGIFTKIVVSVDSEEELLEIYSKAKSDNVPCSLIQDNGLTEFHNVPTYTCVAIGPAYEDVVSKYTGHLKLL